MNGKTNADVVCEFIRGLMHGAKQPIYLILDGHPIYKSRKVKECIDWGSGRLKIFYLTAYSPKLNPDEQVWRDLKINGIGRGEVVDREDLEDKVVNYLSELKGLPKKIKSFFQHLMTKYVAE